LTPEEAEKQEKPVVFDTFSILVVSRRSSISRTPEAFFVDSAR
jgi:hypothetical protein